MTKLKYTFITFSLLALFMYGSNAAEMDHSQHMNMDHSTMQHAPRKQMSTQPAQQGQLQRLSEMPASGKGREAGYDGRYAMEATSVNDDLQTKCAKATRGLVMVDSKTWAQCGGKPEGWSKGPGNAAPMDHSQHMMH